MTARRTPARSGCCEIAERGRPLRPRPVDRRPPRPPAARATPTPWSARPRPVAAALLDYVDLGVDIISARGYDLLDDAIDFGRHVIPLVREEVAKRDAAAAAATAVPA